MTDNWSRVGRVGAWAAAGLLGAALLAPFASAQTNPPSPPPSDGGGQPDEQLRQDGRRPGGPRHGRGRGHMKHGTPGRGIHGEVTVRRGDGYVAVVFQRGEVTARDGSSMTVRSPDGYTATWRLDNDTDIRSGREKVPASEIDVGDRVGVMGERTSAGIATKRVRIQDSQAREDAPERRPERVGSDTSVNMPTAWNDAAVPA